MYTNLQLTALHSNIGAHLKWISDLDVLIKMCKWMWCDLRLSHLASRLVVKPWGWYCGKNYLTKKNLTQQCDYYVAIIWFGSLLLKKCRLLANNWQFTPWYFFLETIPPPTNMMLLGLVSHCYHKAWREILGIYHVLWFDRMENQDMCNLCISKYPLLILLLWSLLTT